MLSPNRCGTPSSALSLSNGFIQVPNGVYFDGGDYTVMAWIYPIAFNSWSRILDFGNGASSDNLHCDLTYDSTGKVAQLIFQGASNKLSLQSNQQLELNKWQHVAFTFTSSNLQANIYVNGSLTALGTATGRPNNIVRTKNFIGKSNWANPNVNAIFDELKIFSVALNQSQIRYEMTNEWFASNPTINTVGSSTISYFFFISPKVR